jgi:LacI family transcriptional regulator
MLEVPVYFDLDLMYPWIPGIYKGFVSAPEARDWNIKLTGYHRQMLTNVEALLNSPDHRKKIKGLVTGDRSFAEICQRKGIPYVATQFNPELSSPASLNAVTSDHYEMGATAAAECLQQGYVRIGALDVKQSFFSWIPLKTQGFLDHLAGVRKGITVLKPPRIELDVAVLSGESEEKLTQWIARQQTPFALAAPNIQLAWVLWKCVQAAGKRIPEEVGVISIGEDPLLLNQTIPPLTAVDEDGFRIGRMCAKVLQGSIMGKPPSGWIKVKPPGIVRRGSTEMSASADPIVGRALKYMAENLANLDNIGQMAKSIHTSPATLLRRFKEFRDCSPAEELRKLRLQRALELIRSTDRSFAEISEECGYGLQSALSRAIRTATGKSPSEIRRQSDHQGHVGVFRS